MVNHAETVPYHRFAATLFAGVSCLFLSFSCTPSEPNDLDKLGTVDMTIKDQVFRLWIADESGEQIRGLMFITREQIAPLPDGTQRGMIFVFDRDQSNSFWMKNTIVPLDIAYVDRDGVVVGMHTMAPLDERYNQYPPKAPYRYAIEVNANRWSQLGLVNGDRLDVPPSLSKRRP